MQTDEGRDLTSLLRARRILVLGSPGSGKSTLSQRLSAALCLPLWAMDDLYWEAGWRRPQEAEFLGRLMLVIEQEHWIIDGNFERYLDLRMKHCDCAVLLDVSPWLCLWRFIVRAVRRWCGSRGSLPQRVAASNERRKFVDTAIVLKILRFRETTLPSLTFRIEAANIPLLRVSLRDVEALVSRIEIIAESVRQGSSVTS